MGERYNNMSLWKQVSKIEGDSTVNLPLNGAKYLISNSENLVDIVNDYSWTISPKSSRGDVPYVHLIEKRVTNNILLQQALYNIRALREIGEIGVETYTKVLQTAAGLTDEELSSILERNFTEDTIKNKDTSSNENERENPYRGLYDLKDTGWQYVFPYFDTMGKSIKGSWGDSKDWIEEAATISNIAVALGAFGGDYQAPVGTYIEKPKQYLYGQTQETYNVTFKLYNTFKYEDIINNWEFCFLLIYQNLPNRRSKTIIDPPSLYEFIIPGIKHCPLAYIQSLKIEFVGATRIMNLVVGNESKQIETIIPDAYKITLQLTDIFPESRNFMAGILDETQRVTVSDSTSNFTQRNSEFLFNLDGNNESNIFNKIGNVISNAGTSVKNAVSGIFGG